MPPAILRCLCLLAIAARILCLTISGGLLLATIASYTFLRHFEFAVANAHAYHGRYIYTLFDGRVNRSDGTDVESTDSVNALLIAALVATACCWALRDYTTAALRAWRIRNSRCSHCNYDLRMHAHAAPCPECGHRNESPRTP